ncbi:MAG: glycine cleavage system protein GcvH [Pseudomonadales bacterium]|nr:glycine cleavage system protein GcvH [Pseudomonadales bacterium]
MSDYPPELRYTRTHEWIGEDETGCCVVGITEYAQDQLGDVVFVELPDTGSTFDAGEDACVIESVKAASDIYCPVAGKVVEVNDALQTEPGLVNEDPYGSGWIFRLEPADVDEGSELMDSSEYRELCEDDSDEDDD